MNKFEALLKSRKFWAAVVGLVVVLIGERAGMDANQLTQAIVLLVTYILGTAVEDARAKPQG